MNPLALWHGLPHRLRLPLLLSGSGCGHLGNILTNETIMGSGEDGNVSSQLLADIALHLWELMPLSPQAAQVALRLHCNAPVMSDAAASVCGQCALLETASIRMARMAENLLESGCYDDLKSLAEKALLIEPGNLFWLHYAIEAAFRGNAVEWLYGIVQSLPLPDGLACWLHGDMAFACEEWLSAAGYYEKAHAILELPELLTRQGEAYARSGVRDMAMCCWKKAFYGRAWQVNLLSRMTDLIRGTDIPGAPPEGKGQILLYTWNHAGDLDQSLTALASSQIGDAGIQVLDNGSDDETSGVLRAWQSRWGSRLDIITLPTNVGAPAARNWLLATEASRAADWVVFLDDDAIVPPQWLGLFGSALRGLRQRSASDAMNCIIGCRILDHAAPMVMQSVDLHLAASFDAMGNLRSPQRLQFMNGHQGDFDFGQYSYIRPAMSVTGCCHLLTRGSMDMVGGFDIRFSPSQFDDVDRDLRSAAKGLACIYQGHLGVRHIKRSGESKRLNAWAKANASGNSQKLIASWPEEKLVSFLQKDIEQLERDVFERLRLLVEAVDEERR